MKKKHFQAKEKKSFECCIRVDIIKQPRLWKTTKSSSFQCNDSKHLLLLWFNNTDDSALLLQVKANLNLNLNLSLTVKQEAALKSQLEFGKIRIFRLHCKVIHILHNQIDFGVQLRVISSFHSHFQHWSFAWKSSLLQIKIFSTDQTLFMTFQFQGSKVNFWHYFWSF